MVRAKPSTKSEVARSSECTEQYAQKVFDNADIVRDAMFQQLSCANCIARTVAMLGWPRVSLPKTSSAYRHPLLEKLIEAALKQRSNRVLDRKAGSKEESGVGPRGDCFSLQDDRMLSDTIVAEDRLTFT